MERRLTPDGFGALTEERSCDARDAREDAGYLDCLQHMDNTSTDSEHVHLWSPSTESQARAAYAQLRQYLFCFSYLLRQLLQNSYLKLAAAAAAAGTIRFGGLRR